MNFNQRQPAQEQTMQTRLKVAAAVLIAFGANGARAQGIPGTEIRQAVEPRYNHITFGGAPGSILADPALEKRPNLAGIIQFSDDHQTRP